MQLHCDNSLGKRNVLSGIHVHVYVYLVFSIFVNSAEFINLFIRHAFWGLQFHCTV